MFYNGDTCLIKLISQFQNETMVMCLSKHGLTFPFPRLHSDMLFAR